MMMWILVIVAVLLLGGVAVVAAGHGAPMKGQGADSSGQLPPDGPVTAQHLREVRFSTVVRGYSMREVDALLHRLERQLAVQHRPGTEPVDGDTRGGDARE